MDTPPDRLRFQPGSFEPAAHFYPRCLNAQLHPLVRFFLRMGNDRIAERYLHLRPGVDPAALHRALGRQNQTFRWAGADLFCTTNEDGVRRLVVVETNSCPSGQKSMPLLDEHEEQGGYRTLIERAFLPSLPRRGIDGGLAVLWDKNPMESLGYARVIADLTGEPVDAVYLPPGRQEDDIRFRDGILELRGEGGWRPIRAALRYVTQRPWDRIPAVTRTHLFNPVLACLAGGRNKMLAAKAYDWHNADLRPSGLAIQIPETIRDVPLAEVPRWVRRLGGLAVVKDPYSNAGQGVWPITNPGELEAFMALPQRYDRFIVQALVGNVRWSSEGRFGRLFHLGTIPDRNGAIFVVDLRVMVGSGPEGYFPVAIYARRARAPLATDLDTGASAWEMLGTNLSVRQGVGAWTSETDRLLLMDQRDFNKVGIGLDDLIEAYLQTILAVTAIDRVAAELVTRRGRFRTRHFRSINPDNALIEEMCR